MNLPGGPSSCARVPCSLWSLFYSGEMPYYVCLTGNQGEEMYRGFGSYLIAATATVMLLLSTAAEARAPRLAVFELELRRVRLSAEGARILRDYLSDRLAATGRYRVVPGDKTRSALNREQLRSQSNCFAKSCQIRIGRALAADRSLSTRVMRIGRRCTVTATLYNLETQVTEKGASAKAGCDEESLQAAIEQVVSELTGGGSPVQDEGPGPTTGGPVVSGGEVTRASARLIVQVTPRTARVKVRGPGGYSSTGGGSWERSDLKPGTYEVVAGAKGYVNASYQVTLSVDDLQTVKLTLQRPGNLLVTGTPAGAQVEVTGLGGFSAVKGFPLSVMGAPGGTYRVKVSRAGYKSEERDAEVRAGATTRVEVKLEKEASAVTGGKAGLVWVRIPGGSFRMGSTEGSAYEKPVHGVQVSSFSLLKSEVTVGQYSACVKAGRCSATHADDGSCYVLVDGSWKQGNLPGAFRGKDQPVVCVDWTQARAFCTWAGGRLPSESEWEYAARSGGRAWKYPWGNEEATCSQAVMGHAKACTDSAPCGCGKNRTWPVCLKASGNSAHGVCDLAGNVWEWVEDCMHTSYTGAPSSGEAWTSNCSDSRRVGRGGGWLGVAGYLRAASRGRRTPGYRDYRLGFRCAR